MLQKVTASVAEYRTEMLWRSKKYTSGEQNALESSGLETLNTYSRFFEADCVTTQLAITHPTQQGKWSALPKQHTGRMHRNNGHRNNGSAPKQRPPTSNSSGFHCSGNLLATHLISPARFHHLRTRISQLHSWFHQLQSCEMFAYGSGVYYAVSTKCELSNNFQSVCSVKKPLMYTCNGFTYTEH